MPNRFSTDVVSMVCRAGTSTRSNECCGRKGIVSWSTHARARRRSGGEVKVTGGKQTPRRFPFAAAGCGRLWMASHECERCSAGMPACSTRSRPNSGDYYLSQGRILRNAVTVYGRELMRSLLSSTGRPQEQASS